MAAPVLLLSRITTLMVVPLIAYCVVSIVHSFSYKRIMAKKIIAMIVYSVMV